MSRGRMLAAALFLGSCVSFALEAQTCRGAAKEKRGSVVLSLGRAAEGATVFGGDAAYRTDRGLMLFGDANRTEYPSVDPPRDRLAIGIGSDAVNSERFGLCPNVSIERERIGDLQVQRYPIGVAFGYWTPLDGVERHLGLTVEPFYVRQHERIDRFTHRSDFVSGRAGVVFGVRRLVTRLMFEHANDADARWNVRVRLGFTFK